MLTPSATAVCPLLMSGVSAETIAPAAGHSVGNWPAELLPGLAFLETTSVSLGQSSGL